jgi:coenzyme F420-reducing hydrogenase delta subunit
MSNDRHVILIGCARSAGEALAGLAEAGHALPAGVEWVSRPCGSGIDELHILRAFEAGADYVVVAVCYDDACRSLDGSRWAARRVEAARLLICEAGMDGSRLIFRQMSPTMGADLLAWLRTLD